MATVVEKVKTNFKVKQNKLIKKGKMLFEPI